MGTNYYTNDGVHIGKSSAAGKYCTRCNLTLCREGMHAIHSGRATKYNYCPKCGYPAVLMPHAISFTWDMTPEEYAELPTHTVVRDEYGAEYPYDSFNQLLPDFRFHFHHLIGKDFS